MTDPDWAELKRKRAEAVERMIQEMCDQHGWDRALVTYHADPNPAGCYCDCPNGGPCEHKWDGPWRTFDPETEGYGGTATCSKCGAHACAHDMWLGP